MTQGDIPPTAYMYKALHVHLYSHYHVPPAPSPHPDIPSDNRKVLLCSARGLKKLQQQLEDSLPSNLSSLYINQHFEDGTPCPVKNCPLNPSARVRSATSYSLDFPSLQ
jgi:hypothetical protein